MSTCFIEFIGRLVDDYPPFLGALDGLYLSEQAYSKNEPTTSLSSIIDNAESCVSNKSLTIAKSITYRVIVSIIAIILITFLCIIAIGLAILYNMGILAIMLIVAVFVVAVFMVCIWSQMDLKDELVECSEILEKEITIYDEERKNQISYALCAYE